MPNRQLTGTPHPPVLPCAPPLLLPLDPVTIIVRLLSALIDQPPLHGWAGSGDVPIANIREYGTHNYTRTVPCGSIAASEKYFKEFTTAPDILVLTAYVDLGLIITLFLVSRLGASGSRSTFVCVCVCVRACVRACVRENDLQGCTC